MTNSKCRKSLIVAVVLVLLMLLRANNVQAKELDILFRQNQYRMHRNQNLLPRVIHRNQMEIEANPFYQSPKQLVIQFKVSNW